MKTERWQQISQIYDVALALGGGASSSAQRLCRIPRYREVESLLAHDGRAENFLKQYRTLHADPRFAAILREMNEP